MVEIVQGIKLHQTHLYTISSVSVICFSVDPSNNNIYIILGRESDFENLINGRNGPWCGFGGKPNIGETIIDTAAREFVEESLACIRLDKAILPSQYTKYFKQQLENGQYELMLRMYYGTVLRIYYVVRVPWQPEVRERFDILRTALFNAHTAQECSFSLGKHPAVHVDEELTVQIRNTYLEKCEVRYWGLDRLNYVINRYGKYKGNVFRRSFLPALKFLVRYLKTYYA